MPAPPRIELNPSYIDVEENSPAEVECFSPNSEAKQILWTRLNGEISPYVELIDGVLRFPYVRREDEGDYQCSARNDYGDDTRILHVYVRGFPAPTTQTPIPNGQLNIQPPNFSGREGDVIVLTCRSISNAYAVVEWNKEGSNFLPTHIDVRDGVLTIYSSVPGDSGRYICSAESGRNPEYADVSIQPARGETGPEPPRVEPLKELYNVIQGSDFILVCNASGSPYPRVEWKKIHEEIGTNVQINGNILKITNAQPHNRGLYVCSAESNSQTAEASTIIDIERKLTLAYPHFPFTNLT